MRAEPTATRLGNAVSGDEAGTTFSVDFANASALAANAIQRVYFYNDTDTSGDQAAGGVGTLDAEL